MLATPVVLWCGWPFFERVWTSIVNRSPEHVHADRTRRWRVLLLQRRCDALLPEFSRLRFRDATEDAPSVYFEPAAAITVLVLLGQVLELNARSRTNAAVRALLDLVAEDGAAR